MRNVITILMTKILCLILKLFGKNGGNLPGKFAYKMNPNIFKYFKIPNISLIFSSSTPAKASSKAIILRESSLAKLNLALLEMKH